MLNRRSLLGRAAAVVCAPFARLLAPALPPDCQGRRAAPLAKGGIVRGGPGYFGAHDHPESVVPLDENIVGYALTDVDEDGNVRVRLADTKAGWKLIDDYFNGTCDAARSRRTASPSDFDGLEAARPAGCESPGSHLIHADFAPDRRALAESINRGGVTGIHVDADDLSDFAEGGRRG